MPDQAGPLSAPHRLYSFPRCATCRKAQAWLETKGISFTLIDITAEPPGKELLRQAMEQEEAVPGSSTPADRVIGPSGLPPSRPWIRSRSWKPWLRTGN